MPDAPDLDLAVIGAGAAGLSITYVAARMGLRVALIERERMGGDCLNTGCVPSKALLAAAHAAADARRAGRLGIRLPEPEVDWAAVRAHVHGAIAAIAPQDSEERYRCLGAEVIRAEARFVAPDAMEVAPARTGGITARRFVVAAGSRAAVPDIPGLRDVPFLTNATIFGMAEKPEHLAHPRRRRHRAGDGAGPRRAGLPRDGGGGAAASRGATTRTRRRAAGGAAAEGVTIIEDATVAAAEPGPTLVLADGRRRRGQPPAGRRRPHARTWRGWGWRRRASAPPPQGIATDAGLRSVTNRRVYASGDIADPEGIGPRQLTHVGTYHAGILARRILFRIPAKLDYAALPRVTYTDPELAQVGMTEAEARQAGRAVQVLRWPFAENDRAIAEGRTEGLAKLVVTPGGRLLGAGIVGRNAGEMIGLWTHAIGGASPRTRSAGMIVPYPTRAEVGKRAASTFSLDRLFAPRTRWLVRALGRLPG